MTIQRAVEERWPVVINDCSNEYKQYKLSRKHRGRIGANALSALEVIAAHLLVEYRVRRWLRGPPLRTLTTVFETSSNLPELPACAPTPAEGARIDALIRRGQEKRHDLDPWATAPRQRALEERRVDDARGAELARVVESELDHFHGAEVPGSAGAKAMRPPDPAPAGPSTADRQ